MSRKKRFEPTYSNFVVETKWPGGKTRVAETSDTTELRAQGKLLITILKEMEEKGITPELILKKRDSWKNLSSATDLDKIITVTLNSTNYDIQTVGQSIGLKPLQVLQRQLKYYAMIIKM